MKFRIVLEFDPETTSFSAVCPALPGCASAGETEDEARHKIEEAIKLYLAPEFSNRDHFDVKGAQADRAKYHTS